MVRPSLAMCNKRTDGIPLFVEEMTKAVLEAESPSAAERTATAVPSTAMGSPAQAFSRLTRHYPTRRWSFCTSVLAVTVARSACWPSGA